MAAFDQLVELLEAEVARLQANLDWLRSSSNPAREQLCRTLVAEIDRREDRLHELRALQQQLAAEPAQAAAIPEPPQEQSDSR